MKLKIKPSYIFAVPFLLITPVSAYVLFSMWFHYVFFGVSVIPIVENNDRLMLLVLGNIFSGVGAIEWFVDLIHPMKYED